MRPFFLFRLLESQPGRLHSVQHKTQDRRDLFQYIASRNVTSKTREAEARGMSTTRWVGCDEAIDARARAASDSPDQWHFRSHCPDVIRAAASKLGLTLTDD